MAAAATVGRAINFDFLSNGKASGRGISPEAFCLYRLTQSNATEGVKTQEFHPEVSGLFRSCLKLGKSVGFTDHDSRRY